MLVVAALSVPSYGVTWTDTGSTIWLGTPSIATMAVPVTTTAEQLSGGRNVVSQTFEVPSSATSTTLDKIAIYIDGAGSPSAYTLRLVDLGVQGSIPNSYAAGTDLWSGTATWSWPWGTGTKQVVELDFTGTEQLVLTAGNTYAFEITGTIDQGGFYWYRGSSGESTYADGTMYDDTGTGTRDFIPAGQRDSDTAVYLIPKFTWDAEGGNTDFDTAANWAGTVAPVAGDNDDSLVFGAKGGANRTVTGADGAYTGLTGISFDGAGGAYSIAGTGSFSFDAGATITGNGGLTHNFNTIGIVTNGAGLTFTGSDSYTIGGVISGTAVTKSGSGTLTLSGNNTYSSGTTLNEGTIVLGHNNALGTGTLTLGGDGTLQSDNDNRSVNNTIANGGHVLTVSGGSNLTLGGVISGAGSLVTNMTADADSLTLTGTNTYEGGTTLTKGTIILGNNAALGTGGLTLGGDGTLQSNDDARSVSNAIATGGYALTVSGASNLTLGGIISGTGSLVTNMTADADTLTLSGTNTYEGGTTLTKGTIILGNNAALGTAGLTLGGDGTLQSDNDNRSVNNTIANGGHILTVSGASDLALGGVISGTGSLTKVGAGTLTLSGTNTYTGGTTVNAGTLTLGAAERLADTGAVTVNAGGTLTLGGAEAIGTLSGTGGTINIGANALTVTQGADLTYAGVISGDGGSLVKSGASTLTLSGDNTYTGGTTVTAGTLAGTTTSLQGNIINNASVTFNQAGNGTYASNMSGTGTLTKLGAGNVTLGGTNTYTGGTTVTAGTLTGTTSSLQGVITNNSAVVFDQAGNGTYAGIMGGIGALTKTGAGTLTLSGTNTFNGLTTLNAGGLILNGQVGGALTVNAGTLSGTGTVGGTLTLNGGTFSPGNSIGTTTIGGNYVQNAGSTLEVEVEKTSSGALRNDLLNVAGTATLAAGSTISVTDISSGSRIIRTGDAFTIIQTGAGVTDNGAAVTDTSAVLSFAGLISGNNYQLVANRETFASNVNGGNKSSVLGAIDSDLGNATGDYVTLINALTALNSAQLNDAAEKLNPLPYASATTSSFRTTQRMTGDLANYLSARRSGIEELTMFNTESRERQLLIADASNDPRTLAYVINENKRIAKMQQDEADSKIKGFFRPLGVFYEHDSTPKMTGFRAQAVGAQFGLDKNYGPNLIMGVGGGYSHSFINFKESRGKGDADSFRVGPYASYFKNNLFVDTSVSFGYHQNEVERDIRFGTINRTADSDYHAYDLSTYIGGGYDFHINKLTVTPTTSLQYILYRNEGFKETGAGAAGLDVDAATSHSLRSKLGVTLSTVTELYGTKIVPELFAGWAHEFINNEDIKARFVQGTAKFTTDVDNGMDDSVYFGAGISALLKENISAFVRYEGEYSSGNSINALNVGITVLF